MNLLNYQYFVWFQKIFIHSLYKFIFEFQKYLEDSSSSDTENNNFSKNDLKDKINIWKEENYRLRQEVRELRTRHNFTDGEYLLLQYLS